MLDILQHKDLNFTKKEDSKWILEHSDKYFIVSDEIKLLFEILKSNNYNIQLAYKEFIKQFDFVSEEQFNQIIDKNIRNLELDNEENIAKQKSFILFETKILSNTKAAKISKYLQPLYQPTFFWIAFTVLFLFSIYNIVNIHHFHLDKKYMLFLFIIYLITAFIHELGHISACNRFTGKNGEIGVGIYFLFPVFYSNITPIWTANKQQRIITNLAGVYIQLYIIAFLYIIYKITDNHQLNDLIAISTIIILYQLIPFIRTDGYWILSDITNSPNLLPNSTKQVVTFFKNPFKFNFNRKKDTIELLYGLINQLVMLYIIINIIFTYKTKLITFPIDLIKTVFKTPEKIWIYLNDNIELIMICLMFYLITFNIIKRIIPINFKAQH